MARIRTTSDLSLMSGATSSARLDASLPIALQVIAAEYRSQTLSDFRAVASFGLASENGSRARS